MKESYRELLETLKKGTPEEKDKVARFICKIRNKEIAGEIVSLLNEKDPVIRSFAVIILCVTGFEKAIKLIEHIRAVSYTHLTLPTN